MHISVATATYYFLPFEQALEIIAGAGFRYIELDLYWQKGPWAMAEHLADYRPREVARRIAENGLRVATIHDGGGMLDGPAFGDLIHPELQDTLDALGYAPDCIVFHPPCLAGAPCCAGAPDLAWWQAKAPQAAQAIQAFATPQTLVTMENMPDLHGYYVPIRTTQELLDFVSRYDLSATLDITHSSKNGLDFIQAAKELGPRLASLHFSDFANGKQHIFIGDGDLDFPRFFREVDLTRLRSLTLECSAAHSGEDLLGLRQADFTQRLALAKSRLDALAPERLVTG